MFAQSSPPSFHRRSLVSLQLRSLGIAGAIALSLIAFGTCAAWADDDAALATQHGRVALSLSLDEKCHLLTQDERATINAEWDETVKLIGNIPDMERRRFVVVSAVAIEDRGLKSIECGHSARSFIDETLTMLAVMQDARAKDAAQHAAPVQ